MKRSENSILCEKFYVLQSGFAFIVALNGIAFQLEMNQIGSCRKFTMK